jgi:transcriptional regulator with XRE-family HTH domain
VSDAFRDRTRKVGDLLRKQREAQDITLQRVGTRLKLSVSYLSDLERGKRDLTDDLVTRYAAALRLSTGIRDELLFKLGSLPPSFHSLVLSEPRLITAASSVMAYFRRELSEDGLLDALRAIRGE